MERHPKMSSVVLNCLFDLTISEVEAADLQFDTQVSFSGVSGREIPDIVIAGDNLHCLIEAKIDPTLELTVRQQEGYQACFKDGSNNRLSFLVPRRWKHSDKVAQAKAALEHRGVQVSLTCWEDLVKKLGEAAEPLGDALINEAIAFWKWRFKMQDMNDAEKQSLLPWPKETYLAIRKLEKTISQAKGLFDVHGFETEPETSDIEGYGFYIKHSNLYVLWIGIWTDSETPLSFGFHRKKRIWLKPTTFPTPVNTLPDYYLWPLEPETWNNPQLIFEKVTSFLDSTNLHDLSKR